MKQEAEAGLAILRTRIEAGGKLKLTVRGLRGLAYDLRIGLGPKETIITVSDEFLSDLPGTKEYQVALDEYVDCLEGRMQNASPQDFYCKTGRPVHVEIDWPLGRTVYDASFVHVDAYDIRHPSTVAKCSVIFLWAPLGKLRRNPLLREKAVVDRIRAAADRQEIRFLKEDDHPSELQQLEIRPENESSPAASTKEVEQFIKGKVYWLGFRREDTLTRAWISDPWDAEYLGVDPSRLRQVAQVLKARGIIALDSKGLFASAADGLLSEADNFEQAASPLSGSSTSSTPLEQSMEWDVFICHASEDKESFVRPLANRLRAEGLKVWYDDFTLQLGDSLRQCIDHGLASSRFGIVVLSPDFLRKNWPQRELDGLVAREVAGKKVILPIWHNVTVDDIRRRSPTLADRVAASSSRGIEDVVEKLLQAISAASG